jgi:hypothetical protein
MHVMMMAVCDHCQLLYLNVDDFPLYSYPSKHRDLSLSPMQPLFPCPFLFDMPYSYQWDHPHPVTLPISFALQVVLPWLKLV